MRKTLLTAALAAACFTTASFAADPPATQKKGMGGHCCSADTTPGWGMMSAEERKKHQEKMTGFKDADSCKAYMDEHHKAMQARAMEKGKTLPKDVGHGCDHLKKA